MSLSQDNRRDVVIYRIERAYIALEQAKMNLQMNCLEVTANRLYYAAYYAVSALLIAHQIPAHKHDGNIRQFSLNFIKTGILPKEMGRLLNKLFAMRQTGDYNDRFDLTTEDVVQQIEPTEEMINRVSALAKEHLGI